MSETCFFLLFDKTSFETTVQRIEGEILSGDSSEAIALLESKKLFVANEVDSAPRTYFSSQVQLGLDVLHHNMTQAFVGEYRPPIQEPKIAFEWNVKTLVRGALTLCVCAVKPSVDYSPAIPFWLRFSAVASEMSPTTEAVIRGAEPDLLTSANIGIFQGTEESLSKEACTRITREIDLGLVASQGLRDEEPETIRQVAHFRELMAAANENQGWSVLKGYV